MVQANSPMFYLGAREGTNNTGELVGIAQALLWVRNDGGDEPAAILYDSESIGLGGGEDGEGSDLAEAAPGRGREGRAGESY